MTSDLKALQLSLTMIFLAACQYGGISSRYEPAFIPVANAETAEIIAEAIGSILEKDSPIIADNAFSDSDTLTVQRTQLLGRDYSAAHMFNLAVRDNVCFLIYQENKAKQPLEGVSCQPLAAISDRVVN